MEYRITLDLNKRYQDKRDYPIIHARPGETCMLIVEVRRDGIRVDLDGYSAQFEAVKKDRRVIIDDDCRIERGRIFYTCPDYLLSTSGVVNGYFTLYEGSRTRYTTETFSIDVEFNSFDFGHGHHHSGYVNLNYEKLRYKPRINGVELVKNVSFEELGITPISRREIYRILNDGGKCECKK